MSKYTPLWEYLKANKKENYKLTYEEIKSILGFNIDHSFLTYKKEAKEYGYEVSKISIKEKTLVFNKIKNIIIRNINEKDIPSIADIQIKGWKSAYKGIIDDSILNAMNKEEKIERLKSNYAKNGFIVAEIENEVVGFCRYADSNEFTPEMQDIDCEITALYVKPDLKYKGIGTRLFQFVIDEFKNKSKVRMILWCLKENEPSKRFYRKKGGEIVGERVIEIGKKSYYEVGFIYHI